MIILGGGGKVGASCSGCARLQADPLRVDRNGEEVDCFGR